ncbi:MAG: DUF1987 domain-containing protein [Bacteroidales bacterium]|nr:DUF1987 domain-containing protein [Bacteroidales bacterium]MBN2698698.1 DUF1987 domain-containing protein [Bacteroidales bacterium]
MEKLMIEQTDDSPFIILDKEQNRFEISGKSLPEDVIEFYLPVMNWLRNYKNDPSGKTEFHFKLIYFNTASSKLILDILMILEEIRETGNEVAVKWYSMPGDEDMREAGEEYSEMINLPFEYMTYEI